MTLGTPEGEGSKVPKLEWEPLGRMSLALSASDMEILLKQRKMIREGQILDQRLISTLERFDTQSEVTSGRCKSIVISRADNESKGTADIFVTRDTRRSGRSLLLIPENRFGTAKKPPEFKPEEVGKTLTQNHGLFFVLDQR